MQLIVNIESTETDIENMSTFKQESLMEKPHVNGTQGTNIVIKAVDEGQETPISNKENIQIQENKMINTEDNGNPEQTKEVVDEGKQIVIDMREEAKLSIEEGTAADEDCNKNINSTEPDCPVIENGIANDTEYNGKEPQNDIAEETKCLKDIKYDTENYTVKGRNQTDDHSIVQEINSVKDTQTPVKNDSIAKNEIKENVDVHQTLNDTVSEIKETVKENSFEVSVPRHAQKYEGTNSNNSELKKSSVAVADAISEIKESKNEERENVKESLHHDVMKEVNTEEKNNSAQLTEDVELLSTEYKNRDYTMKKDYSKNENKTSSESSKDVVEMVSVEVKHKCDPNSQVSETTIAPKDITASSKDGEIIIVENKDDAAIQVTTELIIVNQNENKKIKNHCTIDVDLNDVKIVQTEDKKDPRDKTQMSSNGQKGVEEKTSTPSIRLSNTLDILSDDDEEPVKATTPVTSKEDTQKVACAENSEKCINLDDDDDIMLIDDVTSNISNKETPKVTTKSEKLDLDVEPVITKEVESSKVPVTSSDKDPVIVEKSTLTEPTEEKRVDENIEEKLEKPRPLIPDNFFKTYKKNLAEMTRDDLEEFCILKIVESIIERSNLNDIKEKLKVMALGIEEYKKKAMMLTKQNRDLQVVLKSIQEEQKNKGGSVITPLKITRSVGMQVMLLGKSREQSIGQNTVANPITNTQTNVNNNTNRPQRNTNQNQRPQKPTNCANSPQTIPVPRLVPASNTNVVNKPAVNTTVNIAKAATPMPTGAKNSPPPAQKTAEKRTHNRVQSVTVDLTDDEPPAKQVPKSSPVPPVRLIPSQNLLSARQQFTQNSPRKVYIPISGPQAQNIRAGQTVMVKSAPSPAPRPTRPPMVRMPQSPVRAAKAPNNNRHPAPLPDAMKQYQPPNWKALPPAPDLKLSKVENGIVISWKIDGYQDDSYEEIASYQLYAYQETSSPPSTALWKKIGDVKALPLPMACTLTQFMAGYKYYFAVRAVDVRSRLGPFSLPGSILLLNKM